MRKLPCIGRSMRYHQPTRYPSIDDYASYVLCIGRATPRCSSARAIDRPASAANLRQPSPTSSVVEKWANLAFQNCHRWTLSSLSPCHNGPVASPEAEDLSSLTHSSCILLPAMRMMAAAAGMNMSASRWPKMSLNSSSKARHRTDVTHSAIGAKLLSPRRKSVAAKALAFANGVACMIHVSNRLVGQFFSTSFCRQLQAARTWKCRRILT